MSKKGQLLLQCKFGCPFLTRRESNGNLGDAHGPALTEQFQSNLVTHGLEIGCHFPIPALEREEARHRIVDAVV